MGEWKIHGISIGYPLDIDYSVNADISSDRVNGSKTQGIVKSIEYTQFKVTFFKEFESDQDEIIFRNQLIQFQNGIEFMPYLLETQEPALEFNGHLVNIKDINMNRYSGQINWMKYDITFVDLGHHSEFHNYIQFRASPVPTAWDSIEANRVVFMYYPVGAIFHSDPPTSTAQTAYGIIDGRANPSSFTMYHQGGVGVERVGIMAWQNGVQLFSPYHPIGAGFMVDNGRIRMTWDSQGHVTYQRWDIRTNTWGSYFALPPYFQFGILDDKNNPLGIFNSRDAVFTKLQLKRFTTEYIEVEQEFQFANGAVVGVMWHLRRGQNDVQIRARGINCGIDYWYMHHFIEYNALFGQQAFFNGISAVLSSTTDINEDLTTPSFYADLHNDYGSGYVGVVNPDKYKAVRATIIANQEEGYFEFSTRHSMNLVKRVWSPPMMFYMGTTNPTTKENQAGFLIDANSQLLHRSRIY